MAIPLILEVLFLDHTRPVVIILLEHLTTTILEAIILEINGGYNVNQVPK
jgi:hypothetical protein